MIELTKQYYDEVKQRKKLEEDNKRLAARIMSRAETLTNKLMEYQPKDHQWGQWHKIFEEEKQKDQLASARAVG